MKINRSLSFILALCMVISLLPAGFLSVSAADNVITYNFAKSACTHEACETPDESGVGSYCETRKWRYLTSNATKSKMYRYEDEAFLRGDGPTQFTAYEIYGLDAGTYDIKLNSRHYKNGTYTGVHLLPISVIDGKTSEAEMQEAIKTAVQSKEYRLAALDLYDENGNTSAATDYALGTKVLDGSEDTKRILVINIEDPTGEVDASQAGSRYIYQNAVTFTRVYPLTAIEASYEDLLVGSELPSPTVIWKSGDNTIDGSSGDVSVEIEENDGSLYKAEDGRIFAVQKGSAVLKVTGTLGSDSVSTRATVTVVERGDFSGANAQYLFYTNAYSDTASLAVSAPDGITEEIIANYAYNDYGDVRPWGLIAAKATRPDSKGNCFGSLGNSSDLSSKEGEWVAFKVKVPAPGKYNVDISGYVYANGGRAEVYMLPYTEKMTFSDITENINTYASSDTYVAAADFAGTNKAVMTREAVGVFTASDELDYDTNGYAEYLMIVKSVAGSSGKYYVYFGGVNLIGEFGLKSVKTEISDTQIGVGEHSEITGITAKKLSGEEADMSGAYIQHIIADESENILKLAADGKSVIGLSEGVGTLITRIIKDNAVTECRTEIEVKEDYNVIRAYLYADSAVAVEKNIEPVVALELANRQVIIGGEVAEYEIVEQSANGVVTLSDDKKTLAASGAGFAKIRAKISARGNIYESDTVEIMVNESGESYSANFTIDFREGAYSGDAYANLADITSYSPYRNWIFHAFGNGSELESYAKIDLASSAATSTAVLWKSYGNGNLVFKVKFPAIGEYRIDSFTQAYAKNRDVCLELYIAPVGDESASGFDALTPENNEYYVGTVDYYETTAAQSIERSFGTKNISETGEYFVIFKSVPGQSKSGAGGDAWYPLMVSFKNENAMNSAEISFGSDTIQLGETAQMSVTIRDAKGEAIENGEDTAERIIYLTSDKSIATVSESGLITGIKEGVAEISALITRDGITISAVCTVKVEDGSGIAENGISVSAADSIYVYGSTQLKLSALMNSGKTIEIPQEFITWNIAEGSDADAVEISESGIITGKAVGEVVLQPVVDESYKNAKDITIPAFTLSVVWDSTINPAIYTLSERENAIKNAKRYSWAKDEVDEIKKEADTFVAAVDTLYQLVVPEGLPGYYHIGHKYDPKKFYCRYCGCNVGLEYGSYGFVVDALKRPWKVQCPDCKRLFPSNDFGSFYELGISESGSFSIDRALQKHHEMFVCEHVKAGEPCTHNPGFPGVPTSKSGSNEWQKEWNAWAKARRTQEWFDYYGYGVEGGYLHNDTYGELNDPRWGVDDGFGYLQSYVSDPKAMGYDTSYSADANGLAEYSYNNAKYPVQHTYIAYFIHQGLWYGQLNAGAGYPALRDAISTLADAFVYTGEAKYGRAGAILLDRIADVWPGFDWYQWKDFRGDNYRGVVADPVFSAIMSPDLASAYDAFLPIYNDPYLVKYLSEHGARYETDENGDWKRDENGEKIPVNLKDSPGALRKNIEDNILLEIFDQTKRGMIWGNFGQHQKGVATAAVALNRLPETKEMIDWLMRPGKGYNTGAEQSEPIAGGGVLNHLIVEVDRDGVGNENAPGYNRDWIKNVLGIAEPLHDYELYPSVDLFDNAKFTKMFLGQIRLTLGGYYGAQIGDSGAVASGGMVMDKETSISCFKYSGDRVLGQAIYKYNGNTSEGLHSSILDEEPEKIKTDIEKIIEEDGELDLGSDMMTGFGFAALRDGGNYNSAAASTKTNNHRDMAIYFGATSGHGHSDTLTLHMSAFGLNIAPDIGYPEQTGSQPNRMEWVRTTISHNTVVVDEKQQDAISDPATPHHFDDSERVKLMDVSADVYDNVDDYRRSVVMVKVNDDVSYGVDFFHILGGSDHMYSFHSQSNDISVIEGLGDLSEQITYTDDAGDTYGTYAGANVKYGADPGGLKTPTYPKGYTWLRNIRSYSDVKEKFIVEFNVEDWNKKMTQKRDVRLRMTMVNDDVPEEVTFAAGHVPQTSTNKNIEGLEYILVRNKGTNLNTTFTTVFEPYEYGNKYIKSIEKVPMVRSADDKPGLVDSYSAVKVTLENGRTDYIMYSTNTDVNYVVDGKINFRGFAGVLTLETVNGEEKVAYSYLNDGEVLTLANAGEPTELLSAYTGKVSGFTDELLKQNYIIFTPDADTEVDVTALTDKYVYVDNDGVQNGAYRIKSARKLDNDDIELDIGDVSVIRSFLDASNMELGYVYNIAKGQSLRIPLSNVTDSSPVIDAVSNVSTSAGSSVSIPINAYSEIGKEIELIGTSVPRGMTINQEDMTLVWKPDKSQVGENHIAITASDGTLETTVHFTVTVYGSTTGGTSGADDAENNSGAASEGAGASGGGGGGGSSGSADNSSGTFESPEDTNGNEAGIAFSDVASDTWYSEAAKWMGERGYMSGTAPGKFSPEVATTRAMLVTILHRISGSPEPAKSHSFEDVPSGSYYEKALSWATENGIVTGHSDTVFAPDELITREQLAAIIYRNEKRLGNDVSVSADISAFDDSEHVSDWAYDAKAWAVGAGIINGTSETTLHPKKNASRAECATILYRIFKDR